MPECDLHDHEIPEKNILKTAKLKFESTHDDLMVELRDENNEFYYCYKNNYTDNNRTPEIANYLVFKYKTCLLEKGGRPWKDINFVVPKELIRFGGNTFSSEKSGGLSCQPFFSLYNSIVKIGDTKFRFIALRSPKDKINLYIPAISFIDEAQNGHEYGELVPHYIRITKKQLETLNKNLNNYLRDGDITNLEIVIGGGATVLESDEKIYNEEFVDYNSLSLFYCEEGKRHYIHRRETKKMLNVECRTHEHSFECYIVEDTISKVDRNKISFLRELKYSEKTAYCFKNNFTDYNLPTNRSKFIKIQFDYLLTPNGDNPLKDIDLIVPSENLEIQGDINLPESGGEDCQPYLSFFNSIKKEPKNGFEFIALKSNVKSVYLYIPSFSFIDIQTPNHGIGQLVTHYIRVTEKQLGVLNHNLKKYITLHDDFSRLVHLIGGGKNGMFRSNEVCDQYCHDYENIALFYCENGKPIIIHEYNHGFN